MRNLFVIFLLAMFILNSTSVIAAGISLVDKNKENPSRVLMSTTAPPLEEGERNFYVDIADKLSEFLIPSETISCIKDNMLKVRFTRLNHESNEEVWLSNYGVVSDFALKIANNPCFAVLVDDFYTEMDKVQDGIKTSYSESDDRLNRTNRPALNAQVGKGSFSELEPGYVWDAALKASGGNVALAMEVVGYCGHDDQMQNIPNLIIDAKNKDSVSTAFRFLTNREERRATSSAIDGDSFDKALEIVNEANKVFMTKMEKEVLNGSNNLSININCPKMDTHFYAPGAVSGELTLDQELIDRIAKLQAPNKGAGALPAKAYHGNFAALLGCRMKSECGISEETAKTVLNTISNSYRGYRLYQLTDKYLQLRREIEAQFDVNWNDEKAIAKHESEIKEWLASNKEYFIKIGLSELYSNGVESLNWERVSEYIDTSLMSRGGAFTGMSAGQSFQAVPLSAGRDPFYDPEYIKLKGRPQMSYCPSWSEERCNKARNRYETWMIDFEWSAAQQSKGVEFSFNHCPAKKINLESSSCEALVKRVNEPMYNPRCGDVPPQ